MCWPASAAGSTSSRPANCERVLAAGGEPGKIVFSGVGKTAEEMRQALDAGILCFNVESESELQRLDRMAGQAGRNDAQRTAAVHASPDKSKPFIVFGTVLPWIGSKWRDIPSEDGLAFKAAVDLQASDWCCLFVKSLVTMNCLSPAISIKS